MSTPRSLLLPAAAYEILFYGGSLAGPIEVTITAIDRTITFNGTSPYRI
jgi:hypothetical protein